MCWSADASILSFIVGCLGIVLAAFKGVSPFYIFYFSSIVAMQLIEYFVWTYGVDSPKYIGTGGQGEASGVSRAASPYVNFICSLAAATLLAIQPIAAILTLETARIPFLAAYIILGSIAHFFDASYFDSMELTIMQRYRIDPEPHLVWKWLNPLPRYTTAVFLLFLLAPLALSGHHGVLAAVLAALIFSVLSSVRAWGSLWCYIVNYIVAFFCLLR